MSSSAVDLVGLGARRSVVVAALAVGLALAGLVLLGRWEDARNVRTQVRGMREVAAAIGPLDAPTLSGYRVLPIFDCLVYRRGTNPFALELCVARDGRVVEAIDRRDPAHHRYWTLRNEQSASTFRVDRAEVDRLLRKMGAT